VLLALFLWGTRMSVPGIDREIVEEFLHQQAGSFLGLFAARGFVLAPITGASMAAFLAVRAGLAAAVGEDEPAYPRARGLAITVYFVLAALQGFTAARACEGFAGAGAYLVPEPGLGFELVAVLTIVAGAALTWLAADRLTLPGIGSGALIVALAAVAWRWPEGAVRLALDPDATPFAMVLRIGTVLPAVVALVAVAMRGPREWPLSTPVRLAALGPLDLVALPVVLASSVTLLDPAPLSVSVVVVLGALGLIVARLATLEDGVSRPLLLLPAALIAVLATGIAVGSAVADGAFARWSDPGPYGGDLAVVVRLESDAPTAGVDTPVIVGRMRALGVDAEAQPAGVDAIVVHLGAVREPTDLLARVLKPGRLAITWVREDGTLAPTPVITNADIAEAAVQYTQQGQPSVRLTFNAAGAARFGDETAAHVGEPFAITLDDRELSRPVVRDAIRGGSAMIEMGSRSADPLGEAQALAVSLSSGPPLAGAWTVASVGQSP
jgi:hypothetical protein